MILRAPCDAARGKLSERRYTGGIESAAGPSYVRLSLGFGDLGWEVTLRA